MRSTCGMGVSGKIPWPRLKIWGEPRTDPRMWSMPASRAFPPAISASGSRLPCVASRAGSPQGFHDAADRLEGEGSEQGRRQRGAETLEELNRLGTRIDLLDEIG